MVHTISSGNQHSNQEEQHSITHINLLLIFRIIATQMKLQNTPKSGYSLIRSEALSLILVKQYQQKGSWQHKGVKPHMWPALAKQGTKRKPISLCRSWNLYDQCLQMHSSSIQPDRMLTMRFSQHERKNLKGLI